MMLWCEREALRLFVAVLPGTYCGAHNKTTGGGRLYTHTHTHSSFSLWSATVEREEEEEEEEEEEWMEEGMDQREREES